MSATSPCHLGGVGFYCNLVLLNSVHALFDLHVDRGPGK